LRESEMRKSKKPVRREPPAWEVYRLKSSPAAFIDLVYARDEEAAIAAAIEEHKIRPADQKRLFARPRLVGLLDRD
jgi:hypothetical protein